MKNRDKAIKEVVGNIARNCIRHQQNLLELDGEQMYVFIKELVDKVESEYASSESEHPYDVWAKEVTNNYTQPIPEGAVYNPDKPKRGRPVKGKE